jgi:hypothetical protein
MDPLSTTVITILGKYVIDKGVELTKEIGPKAVEAAAKLFQKVMEHLGKDPADAKNMERFEKKPEDYKAPVADALEEHIKKDAAFAAEIRQLLAQYQSAAPAGAPGTTIITQTAGDDAIQFGQVTGGTVAITRDKPEKTA